MEQVESQADDMQPPTQKALEEIRIALDNPGEKIDFASIADKMELSHLSYSIVRHPNGDTIKFQNWGTLPRGFIDAFSARSWRGRHPASLREGLDRQPWHWHRAFETDAAIRDNLALARDFGIGPMGCTFKIGWDHGAISAVSFARPGKEGDWQRYFKDRRLTLRFLTCWLHLSLSRESAGIISAPLPLTGRELECLKWAADGKTSWETSVILGIAEGTVEFCLEAAKKKLKASNKIHAVTIAIRNGWM